MLFSFLLCVFEMSKVCFQLVLVCLCASVIKRWHDEVLWGRTTPTNLSLAIVPLRKASLWRKISGDEGIRSKRKPAWLILGLLLLSGDVELNPGPETYGAGTYIQARRTVY